MPSRKRPLDVSRGNLNIAMAPYRYTFKRIAKRWWSKNVITSMGLGFTIFCLVFSDNLFRYHIYFFIFSVDYWFLLLTVDIFLYLIKKDKKINK